MKYIKALCRALAVLVVLVAFSKTAAAQDVADETASSNPEVIALIDVAQNKLSALAGAMNDEQWAWRPADGVRSTSEVLMHISFANFFLPSMLGVAPPEGFPVTMGPEGPVGMAEYEAISDRSEVMAQLEGSFEHIKSAFAGVRADRMDEDMTVFGQTMKVRGFCIFLTTHLHEHLGQLVAYARTNGVAPPWSAGG
jgi:uncharacterized damage-inducible protein DinB